MKLHQLDYEETKRFSPIFLDYINNKKELQSHYHYRPEIESFKEAIANRKFDDAKRPVLVRILKEQYNGIDQNNALSKNIGLLSESNTFTITTGHQLNIFTGPLFFIYKIVATINMANMLNAKYPDQHFVPVYWMATEDHDFEEINHFNLFGKVHVWESAEQGPVGKFDTKSMKKLFADLPELPDVFSKAYLEHKDLASATRYLVNHLFGAHGLVIIDGDDKELKSWLKPVIKSDLFQCKPHEYAECCSQILEKKGYKTQIFPRPINLFYMKPGMRERIEEKDGTYHVLNSPMQFSKEEMEKLIEECPEQFSPNVVLRPLYQEIVLPNLAYVGGPAEVAYWLQLKDVFNYFQIPFPILFPRLFGLIIPKAISRKMDKLELDIPGLFEEFETQKEKVLYKDHEPKHDLSTEIQMMEVIFKSIQSKAVEIDQSMEGYVLSEQKKVEKEMLDIQKRLKKAEEDREQIQIKQLESIAQKLFPKGHPQEREENFLNYYINDPDFIQGLIDQLDPFSLKYNVLKEDA